MLFFALKVPKDDTINTNVIIMTNELWRIIIITSYLLYLFLLKNLS